MALDRKPSEGENRRLREQLDSVQRSFQNFVYVVSHDLGAPLRAVTGFSNILQIKYADRFDEKGRTYLNFIAEGGGKTQSMLAELLRYSRVYTQISPDTQVDMSAALRRVMMDMRGKISACGARIEYKNLPAVFADDHQVSMLLGILLDNALTYHHAGQTPHVTIDAQDSGRMWRIAVSDNGLGIAPENRIAVFQIFKRLHAEEAYPGVGMGLAIAQRIVERHGGIIGIDPNMPQGCVVWFTLPKFPPDESLLDDAKGA